MLRSYKDCRQGHQHCWVPLDQNVIMMVTTDPDSVPDQSKFINLRSTAGWGGGGGGGVRGGGGQENVSISPSLSTSFPV